MKNSRTVILMWALVSAVFSFWAGRSLSINRYEEKIAQLEKKYSQSEDQSGDVSERPVDEIPAGGVTQRQPEQFPQARANDGTLPSAPDDRSRENSSRENVASPATAGSGMAEPRPAVPGSAGSTEQPTSQAVPVVQEATTFAGRSLDVPALTDRHCEYATINSNTQMTRSLIWNLERGAVILGNVPEGSIVEILSSHLERWVDYPGEHGLLVRIVRTSLREMESQTGYIELRRINHKRCNIGAEFEM